MQGKNTQKISYTSFFFFSFVYKEGVERVGWVGSWYINITEVNIIIIVIISHHHNKSLYMDID